MSAYILDTETHDVTDPEVIELCYAGPIEALLLGPLQYIGHVMRFKPSKPISLGAMATHHIIDADLVDCPPWSGFTLPSDCAYIVGHNVDFDWKAIGLPNVKRICTLALARKYFAKLDSHSLSALTYHLNEPSIARDRLRSAHSAATDVALTLELLQAMRDLNGWPADWEQIWQISEQARIPERMTFGKFGPKDGQLGMLISEMRRIDPGYVRWLLTSCDQVKEDPYLRKALTQ